MTIIYPVPETLPDPRARFIQIVNTCLAFAEMGIKVKLYAPLRHGFSAGQVLEFYGMPPHPGLEIIRLPAFRGEGKRFFRMSWHGIFYFFLLFHIVRSGSLKERGTVLFLRHLKLAHFLLGYRSLLRVPFIFEVHEIFHSTTVNLRKKESIRDIELSVYRDTDVLVAISHSIRSVLEEMGIRERTIHVIPNGISQRWFSVQKVPGSSAICYTGSLYQWKGVDVLIRAMKHLPAEQLVVVGGGSRLEELRRLAEEEGVAERISFVGHVSHREIPDYLSRMGIAVLPNLPSGPSKFTSPLKLFEYMASGIPVVASDIPVFHEILRDGENALFFEAGDPVMLAEAIRKVLSDPGLAGRISRTAREDARNYTYARRVERFTDALAQLKTAAGTSPFSARGARL